MLRWGNGERGTLSSTQFQTMMNYWDDIAIPNAGRVWLRWWDARTGTWVVSRCLMMRPMSRPLGTDGAGTRHADVVLEFRSLGLPS